MRFLIITLLLPLISLCQSQFMMERSIPFKSKNNWGLADKRNGTIILEPKYDSIFYNEDKGFAFIKNNKYGIIDCSGYDNCDEILNPIYDIIHHTSKGYLTKISGKKGFSNPSGEKLLENIYDTIEVVDDYLFVSHHKGFSSGVYDLEKRKFIVPLNFKIIPIDFDNFWKSKEEIEKQALIKFYLFETINNKYFYLNKNYQLVELKLLSGLNANEKTSTKYKENIQMAESQDLAFLKNSKSYFDSYFEYKKRKKIKYQKINFYPTIDCINENVIISNKENSLFGVVSKNSDSIKVPPIYEKISYFKHKYGILLQALKDFKKSLYYNGNRISNNEYDEVLYSEEYNLFIIKKNDLYGFIFVKESLLNLKKIVQFQIIEPKFKEYLLSNNYSDYGSQTFIFEVIDSENSKYYVNNNGIEFKQ